MVLLSIHPTNPEARKINQAVDILKKGGVIIYPTDSVYALGCDLNNVKAAEKIAQIKNLKLKAAKFSLICEDLSQAAEYVKQLDRSTFKLIKHNTPGPFTFILPASGMVSDKLSYKRKEIGIRIPDHAITQALVEALGNPIMTTSLNAEDDIQEYFTDPEQVYDIYGNRVELVIDGGFGELEPSTLVNCLSGEAEIIRAGKGALQ